MSQPNWKCVAQLGDVNPIKYGGLWVLVDQAGGYQPELEVLEVEEWTITRGKRKGDPAYNYTIYRVQLDPVTMMADILSDNPHHPELQAWWADDVMGQPEDERDRLILLLCSDDPVQRAHGYMEIASIWSWSEFDHQPLRYAWKERLRVHSRYRKKMYQVVA